MGAFPCVRDLPVYFTETVDRELRVYKNTRGRLVGWQLDALDRAALHAEAGSKICMSTILNRLPLELYVKVAGVLNKSTHDDSF